MNMKNIELNRNAVSAGKVALMVGLGLLLVSNGAFAADAMGDGICAVVKALTGKWLFGFTILATLGAGAALLFGAEITDGLKKIATIITIVGMILGMSSILSMAFSTFGSSAC